MSVSVTENGAPRPLVAGTQIRLNFTDQDLSASAGCNTIGGRYRVEAGVLLVEATGMTEMGCDPARHAQDDWLAAFLGARPEVSLNGNDLVLSTPTTVVTLLDREVAEPDLGLVGPTWTVVSLISGDAVSSIPDGINATLKFGDDGSFGFESGCNSGGGRVTVGNGTLNFSDIVVTDEGCGGAAGQVEGQFLGLLSAGQVSYTIDSGSLVLQVGDRGLQFAGR